MKSIIVLTLFTLSSFAETFEYKIDGMSCGGCKAMIKSVICELPGIKSCTVEIGSMKLSSEDGKSIDQEAITKALAALNEKNKEDYKIASSKKVVVETPTKKVEKK